MKNIITVSGIRPDFIRMSEIFKAFDSSNKINHTLVHTGQHFDRLLSDVFFEELDIRSPDYNLEIGGKGKEHFHQNAELTVKLIELIRNEKLNPDWIFFLGDSNSVLVAPSLAKEGYRVAHIEAGMRSGDKRMLEEINRIVCDHSSDMLFTYHPDYSQNLFDEKIPQDKVVCVGNTIVEVVKNNFPPHAVKEKKNNLILLDIHRPENFNYQNRLEGIFNLASKLSKEFKLPCVSLDFNRAYKKIKEFNINTGEIERVPLMSYKKYLETVNNSLFIISDSGTAQEEPALLSTPVLVPRDFTERPQSYDNLCSYKISIEGEIDIPNIIDYVSVASKKMDSNWLGEGLTSKKITKKVENV